MNTNQSTARIAGLLYLLVAVTAFFTDIVVRKGLIVAGDPSATAHNIIGSECLFRVGTVSNLLMATCWILLAFTLYGLFKSVNKNSALLMVSLVLVGSAVTCINTLNQFTALQVLNNGGYLKVFGTEQQQALAMLLLDLSKNGTFVAYIFFGLWLLPLAYLIIKSGFIPKILGILLIIAGLGYLIDFLVFYLFPNFTLAITPYTFWGELLLLLWLLIKGVNSPKELAT